MQPLELSRGFQRLTESRDWRRIAKIPGVANVFNVFQILDDAVCENSWSRILAVLFTSSGGHDLDMRPLKTWVSVAAGSRFRALANRAVASSAICEWGTTERRRLDILVKLLDKHGRLIGVVGVENKVWSGEQPNQLSDYQAALCRAFPDVPKILLFLTPGEREPLTGVNNRSCPCRPCSYTTLVRMCEKLRLFANKDMRLLLSSLHDFIGQKILAASVMRTRIKQAVRKLYQNRNHREILEGIFENRPTLEDVCSQIDKSAKEYFAGNAPHINCTFDQWPKRTAYPREISVFPKPLGKHGFSIYYLFRSRSHHPFIGDKFTILIAAWCESAAARERVRDLNARLPRRMTHSFPNWNKWEVIWEGDTYELQDLDGRDARNLSRLLTETISKTFRPLESAVRKV